MKKISLSIALLGLLISCKSGSEKVAEQHVSKLESESCIQPIAGLEIKPQIFVIDASNAQTISVPSGSKIHLPASAFVNAQGETVRGKVDIEWQEYHSLTDIALSGIPMQYDSAGVQHDFVSGGMFTINAKQKGEKLELAEGKKVKVDLASTQDTPCFNFYTLDEQKGKWDYVTTKAGTPLPEVAEEPVKKITKDSAPVLIDAEVNVSAFPELEDKQIVAWKTNEKVNKTMLESRNSTYKLLPGAKEKEYIMEITLNSVKINIPVQPYTLQQAGANSAKAEKQLKENFDAELQFQNDLASGKIIRSIELESMGTCNWDAIMKLPNKREILATLAFPERIKAKGVKLFFVCPELNALIRINTEEARSPIKFDPTYEFVVVGISPDNRLLTLDKSQMNKLKKADKIIQLDFADSGKKIRSGKHFSESIRNLI